MNMTAVEWLWNALLDNGFQELENVEGFYYQAKEVEKQQRRYSEGDMFKAFGFGQVNNNREDFKEFLKQLKSE